MKIIVSELLVAKNIEGTRVREILGIDITR